MTSSAESPGRITHVFSLVLANTPPKWAGTMRWISILMLLAFLRHPKHGKGVDLLDTFGVACRS